MTTLCLVLLLQADKKIEEALVAFGKAYAGNEPQKLEALDKLKGLRHDKVYAALAGCLNQKEPEAVRAKAVDLLGECDHPTVAKTLADAVKTNTGSKLMLKAFSKAIQTNSWDSFHLALCEPLIMSQRDPKLNNEKIVSDAAWEYLNQLEKEGTVVAFDGLIKLLKQYEEDRRAGYGAGDWYKKVHACLKAITGVEKEEAKEYEAYWKKNKANAANTFMYVHWCPATHKRWDRKGMDAKAHCPHHEDRKGSSKESPVLALTKTK